MARRTKRRKCEIVLCYLSYITQTYAANLLQFVEPLSDHVVQVSQLLVLLLQLTTRSATSHQVCRGRCSHALSLRRGHTTRQVTVTCDLQNIGKTSKGQKHVIEFRHVQIYSIIKFKLTQWSYKFRNFQYIAFNKLKQPYN